MSLDSGKAQAYTPLDGLARNLTILIILEVVLGFVGVFFEAISIASLIIALITLIAFLLWFYKANRNLSALGGSELKFTPRWSVIWWFIPIANFWMPYLATVEIAKASDPSVGTTNRQDRQQMKTPRLILIWWLYSIASGVVFFAILVAAGLWTVIRPASFDSPENILVNLAGAAITAVSLWLMISVIREITSRQTQKIQAVRSDST